MTTTSSCRRSWRRSTVESVLFGAGKAGLVIAWDSSTHKRLWETAVGVHRNDRGPLPRRPVSVCPGLFGGVETPMAYAGGRLFVPVVDLCMRGSSVGYEPLDQVNVAARGRGELVALDAATGHEVWTRHLPQANFGCATVANGVVFTATFDGTVYGFDASDGRIALAYATPGGRQRLPCPLLGMAARRRRGADRRRFASRTDRIHRRRPLRSRRPGVAVPVTSDPETG